MFELIHKLHVVLNDLKGLEAGYTSKKSDVLFIRLEETIVYKLEFTKVGDVKSNDMFDEFDKLGKVKNPSTFNVVKKLNNVLEIFKDFALGYTTTNMETLFLEFKDMMYKLEIEELGEGRIQDYI